MTKTTSKRYSVEQARLTRDEYNRGLIAAWNVVCRDENGSHVVGTYDSRTVARDAAKRLRGAS